MCTRRPVAMLLFAAALHVVIGSTAGAMTGATPASPLLEGQQWPSAITLSDLSVSGLATSLSVTARVVDGARALRNMDRDTLLALRQAFVAYGERSKRGIESVALSLGVIDALLASTETEFRRRIQQIPIRIVTRPAAGGGERSGATLEYYVRGKRKTRNLEALGRDLSARVTEVIPEGVLGAAMVEGVEDGAEYAAVTVTETHYCEYTDPDGVFWSGTCATQQQIDEAWVISIALQEDADAIEAEIQQATLLYCHQNPLDCPLDSEDDNAANFALAMMTGGDELVGGPYQPDACFAMGSAVGEDFTLSVVALGCGYRAAAYAGALVTFGRLAFKLNTVLRAGAPPAGAVADAVVAAVVAGGAVVTAGVWLHDCYLAQ